MFYKPKKTSPRVLFLIQNSIIRYQQANVNYLQSNLIQDNMYVNYLLKKQFVKWCYYK